MADLLDFEEPVGVLLKEIEALNLMPQTPERRAAILQLETRATALRVEIYASLKPWQRVQVARHANRPGMQDYVDRLFTGFTELHGDRRFADDKAIVTGMAYFHGEPVVVIGHQKGRDTKQKIYRNFGYAKPEGYRKALRVMRLAEKFGRPVIAFVDTPAAYPGIESEERGVAEAIARESPRNGPARRAHRRRRVRRRRQRRRAGDCGGRSRAHAGILDVQRHSA